MKDYCDLNDYEVIYMIGEKSDDATNLLFEKYKPVVNKIAKEYYQYGKNLGLEYQDFIQEGYLGLNAAIKNYTEDKNCLFYTYANICIRSKLGNLLRCNDTLKNYALNNSISLYSDNDMGKDLIDYISDPNQISPDIEFDKKEFISKLNKIIYDLDIDKAAVLELKYNGFTNQEIAKLLDSNRKTITRIITLLKKKLGYYR